MILMDRLSTKRMCVGVDIALRTARPGPGGWAFSRVI